MNQEIKTGYFDINSIRKAMRSMSNENAMALRYRSLEPLAQGLIAINLLKRALQDIRVKRVDRCTLFRRIILDPKTRLLTPVEFKVNVSSPGQVKMLVKAMLDLGLLLSNDEKIAQVPNYLDRLVRGGHEDV